MIVSRSVIIFVVVVALLSLSGATRAPCHGERRSERESASVEDTHTHIEGESEKVDRERKSEEGDRGRDENKNPDHDGESGREKQ